jgi:hypothetical protein
MRTRQGVAQASRPSVHARGAEATRHLREVFRLPTNPKDTDILGTALAEAAIEEGKHNPQFAGEVRRRYEELLGLRASTAKPVEDLPPLVPIRTDMPYRASDPFAPPDPQFLTQVYGRGQLARALHDYTVDKLKQTAAVIERAHPGTKPKNRGQRDALIAYIVEQS